MATQMPRQMEWRMVFWPNGSSCPLGRLSSVDSNCRYGRRTIPSAAKRKHGVAAVVDVAGYDDGACVRGQAVAPAAAPRGGIEPQTWPVAAVAETRTTGWFLAVSDEREGFELAILPPRYFAALLTSVLPRASTEVRRKSAIRERFCDQPRAARCLGSLENYANAIG